MSASVRHTKDMSRASKPEKVVAALPAKETSWVRMKNTDGDVFVITATPDRTSYNLYQVVTEGLRKIAKSPNPKELDAIVYHSAGSK